MSQLYDSDWPGTNLVKGMRIDECDGCKYEIMADKSYRCHWCGTVNTEGLPK